MTVSRCAIVGDGVIGMAVAVRAAVAGHAVTVYAPSLAGAASPASAGMMAPSVERIPGAAQSFGDDARDAWPRLAQIVAGLDAGIIDVRRNGLLQLALSDIDVARLQGGLGPDDDWLDAPAVLALEPQVAGTVRGAARYPCDGFVDVPSAVAALRRAVAGHRHIEVVPTPAVRLEGRAAGACVEDAAGLARDVDHVVLAAGAWSSTLAGLPRPLPVRPLRGALMSVAASLVREPIYGPDGHSYLLPRAGGTLIGATSDWVGFDTSVGSTDAERLLAGAAALVPSVREAAASTAWTGLRPMTPDGRPIIGPDPDWPALIYACGHSRNGFLHAALTAEVVTDLISGAPTRDLAAFSVLR